MVSVELGDVVMVGSLEVVDIALGDGHDEKRC